MGKWIKISKAFNVVLGIGTVGLLTWGAMTLVNPAMAQEPSGYVTGPSSHASQAEMPLSEAAAQAHAQGWAFFAAALATGIGSIAAGYAVSNVGTAAVAAVAEKSELMGKALIYVALAEGIAIYGLLISIIVLSKV